MTRRSVSRMVALVAVVWAAVSLLWPNLLAASAPAIATPITGVADVDLVPFDDMMRAFLAANQVPGAALAVAKDGKLIYARAFGFADAQLGLPVEPTMRFRVASISKPITGALILRLVELGLLKLEENPFAILNLPLPAESDPRLRKVTLLHVLHHTAGWDTKASGDPMFRPVAIAKAENVQPPAAAIDIVHYMLRQKLDFEPGERYAYSNFGYCLLGRVIEKATGLTYEAAVQRHLFDPLGIRQTQLGRTLTTAKNEVKYYDVKGRTAKAIMGPNFGKPVPLPYGTWHLEAMDSHGGWISTAPDLVRFASAFDNPKACKVLTARSIHTMFDRPIGLAGHDKDGKPLDVHYGCGWNVRTVGAGKVNTWHNGMLDGTASLLVRRSDGLTWAVLLNASVNEKGQYLGKIDPLVHQAANKITRWPTQNFFEKAN